MTGDRTRLETKRLQTAGHRRVGLGSLRRLDLFDHLHTLDHLLQLTHRHRHLGLTRTDMSEVGHLLLVVDDLAVDDRPLDPGLVVEQVAVADARDTLQQVQRSAFSSQ